MNPNEERKTYTHARFHRADLSSHRAFSLSLSLSLSLRFGSEEDAYQSAAALVARLGDQYTRYLPPAKYNSLVSSATGEIAGVGVTLEEDADRGGTVSLLAVEASRARSEPTTRGVVIVISLVAPAVALRRVEARSRSSRRDGVPSPVFSRRRRAAARRAGARSSRRAGSRRRGVLCCSVVGWCVTFFF